MSEAILLAHVDGFRSENVGNGLLETGGDVSDAELNSVTLLGLHPPTHRGLKAGKGVVEAMFNHVVASRQSAWETNRCRVPLGGSLVDDRPTRVRQAKHAGHFVVGLASSVVDRRADLNNVCGDVVYPQQAGMAA